MARKKSRRPTKKQTVKKKPIKKKPRRTRATGGPVTREVLKAGPYAGESPSVHITSGTIPPDDGAVPRKLADTDEQIQALRHHVSEQGVSIASSIDTIPLGMIPQEMRERWLRELRQTAVALALLVERLAGGPPTEA